jgi:hypothetical protein
VSVNLQVRPFRTRPKVISSLLAASGDLELNPWMITRATARLGDRRTLTIVGLPMRGPISLTADASRPGVALLTALLVMSWLTAETSWNWTLWNQFSNARSGEPRGRRSMSCLVTTRRKDVSPISEIALSGCGRSGRSRSSSPQPIPARAHAAASAPSRFRRIMPTSRRSRAGPCRQHNDADRPSSPDRWTVRSKSGGTEDE